MDIEELFESICMLYGVKSEGDYQPLSEGSNEVKEMRCTLFLQNSDFRILQHIREETLGIEKTLTDEEYQELEKARQYAVEQIRLLNQV